MLLLGLILCLRLKLICPVSWPFRHRASPCTPFLSSRFSAKSNKYEKCCSAAPSTICKAAPLSSS